MRTTTNSRSCKFSHLRFPTLWVTLVMRWSRSYVTKSGHFVKFSRKVSIFFVFENTSFRKSVPEGSEAPRAPTARLITAAGGGVHGAARPARAPYLFFLRAWLDRAAVRRVATHAATGHARTQLALRIRKPCRTKLLLLDSRP